MNERDQDATAAAAASIEELNRKHETDMLQMKASRLREAADLIEDYEPKMAATLWGKAYKAKVAWSAMAEPD